jgi:hypothetical protein
MTTGRESQVHLSRYTVTQDQVVCRMLTVRSSEGEDFALGFFSPPAPTRQWHSVAEKHKHTREGEFVQGAWLLTKEDRTGLKRVFDNAARGHHACIMQDHTSKLSLLANFAMQKSHTIARFMIYHGLAQHMQVLCKNGSWA